MNGHQTLTTLASKLLLMIHAYGVYIKEKKYTNISIEQLPDGVSLSTVTSEQANEIVRDLAFRGQQPKGAEEKETSQYNWSQLSATNVTETLRGEWKKNEDNDRSPELGLIFKAAQQLSKLVTRQKLIAGRVAKGGQDLENDFIAEAGQLLKDLKQLITDLLETINNGTTLITQAFAEQIVNGANRKIKSASYTRISGSHFGHFMYETGLLACGLIKDGQLNTEFLDTAFDEIKKEYAELVLNSQQTKQRLEREHQLMIDEKDAIIDKKDATIAKLKAQIADRERVIVEQQNEISRRDDTITVLQQKADETKSDVNVPSTFPFPLLTTHLSQVFRFQQTSTKLGTPPRADESQGNKEKRSNARKSPTPSG